MHLVIAEKPSVAADIARALCGNELSRDGNNYLGDYRGQPICVTAARGHLLELAVPEGTRNPFELEDLPLLIEEFALRPRDDSAGNVLSNILSKAKNADVDTIINACDAGREGELIFRFIAKAGRFKKPMKRVWLQSMTTQGIRDAFKNIMDASAKDALADAAYCRAEADWLVGINASRAISRYQERKTGQRMNRTAGRVQTPTLSILVSREKEIAGFVSRPFWRVKGVFQAKAGDYEGLWTAPKNDDGDGNVEGSRFFDKGEAQGVVNGLSRGQPVDRVEETQKQELRSPKKLFDLTTLQREANAKFGLTAAQTLSVAQSLYETHKVLSYPRTDSNCLPSDYPAKVEEIIGKVPDAYQKLGKMILEKKWIDPSNKQVFNDAKISDHFAIIPTERTPGDNLSEDERRVYDLVVRRFLAVFYPPAEFLVTNRKTHIDENVFVTKGRILKSEGWLEVYGGARTDESDTPLGPVEPEEKPIIKNIDLVEDKTKAPPYFTEATLLSAMENAGKALEDDLAEAMKERGLGTPATRAAMIEKLIFVKYIARGKKNLRPTKDGIELIDFLVSAGLEPLTSPALTGEWEHRLSQMESGKYPRSKYMEEIRGYVGDIVKHIRDVAPSPSESKYVKTGQGAAQHLKTNCPDCGKKIVIRPKSFSCESAECGFTLWKEIAQRKLSQAEAEQLLKTKSLPKKEGFMGKKGSFAAGLALQGKGKVTFVFEK